MYLQLNNIGHQAVKLISETLSVVSLVYKIHVHNMLNG